MRVSYLLLGIHITVLALADEVTLEDSVASSQSSSSSHLC